MCSGSQVEATFSHYPKEINAKLQIIRQLIIDVASESPDVLDFDETLKWGEPAYTSKTGSTLRLGWKKSAPTQYAVYFHCKTTLVETFREIYRDLFKYEGNRAILFNLSDDVPMDALRQCILLSLTYHKVKHLPLLGY